MAHRNRPQSIENKERARVAVDLRVAGATWRQIADAIDMQTEQGARLLVNRYFNIHAKQQLEELHPVLIERGETLYRNAFNRLTMITKNGGSTDEWEKAFRQTIAASNFLARISGFNDGPKVEVNVGATRDLSQLRAEFMRLRAPKIIDGDVTDGDVTDGDDTNEADTNEADDQ